MKITIDSKTGEVKVNGKLLKDAPEHYKAIAEYSLRQAYENNYPLDSYDEDSVWMSYRYCIGRHTIASHMRAGDIWKHCKGRMNKDRQLFNAFDINREIEDKLRFGMGGPKWHFPITSLNRIYTPAIDIFCEFLEDFDIKSKEDYLKYYSIDVMLTDNERGYKIETTTWEEYLRPKVHKIVSEFYHTDTVTEDYAWQYFEKWDNNEDDFGKLGEQFHELTKHRANPEYFYFHDIEDLFVWNDLVHCFDHEHHHKSILIDGTECEWFWSWTHKSEESKDEPGKYYYTFGYEEIRVPVDKWNGSVTTWIPDESIKKEIY